MEAEIFDTQLLHKFKAGVHLGLGMRHSALLCTKGLVSSVTAEHIGATGTQVVPPCHGKGQMLTHRLAHNDLIGVVELKCQRIGGIGALVGDHGNVGKIHIGFLLIEFPGTVLSLPGRSS